MFGVINGTFELGALILWCDVYLLWLIQFVTQSVSKVKVGPPRCVQGFVEYHFHSSLTHLRQLVLYERRMQCFLLRNILGTLVCIRHQSPVSGTL